MIFDCYLEAGEPTACANIDFINEAAKAVTMTDHFPTPEARQAHYQRYFEMFDRWEWLNLDEEGNTIALMVLAVDPYDGHKGEPVLHDLTSNSLKPGALTAGYRYMRELAREQGINWIYLARSEGEEVHGKYYPVKPKK